jgi:hypothetical protein
MVSVGKETRSNLKHLLTSKIAERMSLDCDAAEAGLAALHIEV